MTTPTAVRALERQVAFYKRTWRGSAISTFLNPILFLSAMGLGLGALVDEGPGGEALGMPYLTYLAPGLLVATAMQTAFGDSSWPLMAQIKWIKTYEATLNTPLGTNALVGGHLIWVGLRLIFTSIVFAAVMAVFGAAPLSGILLALPAAVMVGLAFGAPVTAYTARLQKDTGLSSVMRFVVVPMFLFSGTFFPISQLPAWMQPIAVITPLWHGVELARLAALEIPSTYPPYVHIGYLLLMFAVGLWLSLRFLRKRLVT